MAFPPPRPRTSGPWLGYQPVGTPRCTLFLKKWIFFLSGSDIQAGPFLVIYCAYFCGSFLIFLRANPFLASGFNHLVHILCVDVFQSVPSFSPLSFLSRSPMDTFHCFFYGSCTPPTPFGMKLSCNLVLSFFGTFLPLPPPAVAFVTPWYTRSHSGHGYRKSGLSEGDSVRRRHRSLGSGQVQNKSPSALYSKIIVPRTAEWCFISNRSVPDPPLPQNLRRKAPVRCPEIFVRASFPPVIASNIPSFTPTLVAK